MRKLISLLMAVALIMSLATVAFAADEVPDQKPEDQNPVEEWDGTYTPVAAGTEFTGVNKTYTNEDNVVVSETLTFTPVAATANPDGGAGNITVANYVVGESEIILVTLPGYDKVGVYRYTFTENDANSAGVTYSSDIIHIIVMVEYDNENHQLVIAETTSFIEEIGGKKDSDFENVFKSGSFTVAKDVTGNMANEKDTFDITVTLTAPEGDTVRNPIKVGGETVTADQWVNGVYTKTLTISENSGKVTFDDIPVGVTVTSVVEDENKMNGYTYVSTTIGDADFTAYAIDDETEKDIVVTNEKKTEIATGIITDSAPYIILISVCAVAAVLFVTKRRSVEF